MALIGVIGKSLLYSVFYNFMNMRHDGMSLTCVIGNSLPYSDGNM